MATTGQSKDWPKTGMVTVVVRHLSCRVFDNFMTIKAFDSPKMTSALQRCWEESKVATECGKMFDNLKKKRNKMSTRLEKLEGV